MGRKRKRSRRAGDRRAQEALQMKVSPDGIGEDPIVRVMLERLPTAGHAEAFEIMQAVQAHMRGEPVDVSDPILRDKIAKARARAVAMDKAEQAFEEDPVKFVEDITEQARKLHPTKAHLERDQAKGAKMYANAQTMARSLQATKRLEIAYRLKNDPKELFMVRGSWNMVGSDKVLKQFKEEVRFDGCQPIFLIPGQRMVPKIVADVLRQRYRDQDEAGARKGAFAKTQRDDKLRKELASIQAEYGGGGLGERMPIPPHTA